MALIRLVADLSPMRPSPTRSVFVKDKEVGDGFDQPGLQKHIDPTVSQTLDIHGPARGKVLYRFLALSRTIKAATATGHGLVIDPDHIGTTHRTMPGQNDLRASAGRFSAITLTTWGITSPARRTITVSPICRSRRAISSMLCRLALLTVTPPTKTGSRRATGVTAPVRPTWNSTPVHHGHGFVGREFERDGPAWRS